MEASTRDNITLAIAITGVFGAELGTFTTVSGYTRRDDPPSKNWAAVGRIAG